MLLIYRFGGREGWKKRKEKCTGGKEIYGREFIDRKELGT